ncbi:MAG: phage holin family protein, partial [Firmicutes bacterium]|nr:phage holin family protein [Bacillota bacterium]
MDNKVEIFIMALLAAFGAIARLLNQQDKMQVGYKGMASGCFVAAFTGVIIYFVAEHFNIAHSLIYALSGISGWIGPHILDLISAAVMNKTGLDKLEQEY